jgi:ferredoxin-nitrate reductase
VAEATRTICPYCGVGCGLIARTEGGRLRAVEGDPRYPVNRGRTCRKPLELAAAVHARDRLTSPLRREHRGGRLRESRWDEAMPALAGRLRELIAEHGPESVAFYISGQLLTEDYYAVNKLAKGFLRTNNVDSNSRLCMSSAVAGYTGAFGADGPPPAYADISLASCLLLVGTNTAACHPIVWSRIRQRREEGAFVICADPRRTPTARESSLHLPLRPGTDLALLNAMLCVIDRDGLADLDFLRRRTSGWEETRAVAREWTPERAAAVCGVDAEAIELAARRFAEGPSMALWSMGANQSSEGTLKNRALINLCLAAGQIGRPGTGPLSLTGQPNAMGGRETGGLAHLLPGYRRVDSASDREEIERHWGVPRELGGISPEPGLPAVELFDALAEGKVKAVWIVATNPVVSLPDSGRAREALERAELVVVQDAHHPTETSALADFVLPAAAWPEKQGTMTNSERRVALVRRALDPPGEALPDWRIFQRLAGELGYGERFAWADEAEVFAEFAACTAGRPCDMSGLSHELLATRGSIQWPHPEGTGAGGTARLYDQRPFPTDDGRARLVPTPPAGPAEAACDEYPLVLTTGRVADQWHTMSRTGKSKRLRDSAGEPFVELNPADAERAGVAAGEPVRLVSRRGSAVARAALEPSLPEGCAFAPFHWGALHAPPGHGQVNRATNPALDPVSRQPELKACAIRIEPARRPAARVAAGANGRARGPVPRRLVVVGTGMTALEVVEEALRRRPDGLRVTMLGEEEGLPYNRIGLSRLLGREASAASLELRPPAWFAQHAVRVLAGRPAAELDLDRALVADADGGQHPYDALVLATGSRPAIPPIAGAEAEHVFSFRTRADVARIEAAARGRRRAVVIGGGLLGLEAAAGLRGHGVVPTVVELAEHLMPQQLDPGGGAMLARAVAKLRISARCGALVERIEPDRVVLTGGEELPADLVVIATGVRPEIKLAERAGIETARGIVVDDELRTSAPAVWAAGECAEHRGTVYGLWAPLAEQARVAAATISGEPGAFHGAVPATTLKVAGVELFAGGTPRADDGDDHDEILISDGRRLVYRKLVLAGEGLAGAVLVGDSEGSVELSELLRSGAEVPDRVLALGGGGEADRPVDPDPKRLVCSCNQVSEGQIRDAIVGGGLSTLAEVARSTRASTGCGSCARDVERLIADAGPRPGELAAELRARSAPRRPREEPAQVGAGASLTVHRAETQT